MKALVSLSLLGAMLLSATACATHGSPAQATITAQGERIAQLEATETPTVEPSSAPALTVAEVMQMAAPSVVRVIAGDDEGTGFVLAQVGQVLTALHVVGDVDAVLAVVAADGAEHRAMVLGADETRDIALLSVPGLPVAPLEIGAYAQIGDTVYALGYAAGLAGEPSITQGIVSARRMLPEIGITLVQTDAPINPGNSGGPLLNARGQVVGVNLLRLRGDWAQYEGMGFALSAEDVASILGPMQSGEVRLLPTPTVQLAQLPTRVPTSVYVATRTPDPIPKWCAFRTKVVAFRAAADAETAKWNARVAKGPLSDAEMQAFANRQADIMVLACSLPRDVPELRSLADTYCRSSDLWLSFLRRGGGLTWNILRVESYELRRQADDAVTDLDKIFDYPYCP
jgi:S1-C subfamily serine protease